MQKLEELGFEFAGRYVVANEKIGFDYGDMATNKKNIIYVKVNENDNILYVGKTSSSFKGRNSNHLRWLNDRTKASKEGINSLARREAERSAIFTGIVNVFVRAAPLTPCPLTGELTEDLDRFEKALQKQLSPLWNVSKKN